jgi:PmbA protein
VADLKELVSRCEGLLTASPEIVSFPPREAPEKSSLTAPYDPTFLEIPDDEKVRRVANLDANLRKADGIGNVMEAAYKEEISRVWVWSSGQARVLQSQSSWARIMATVSGQAEGDAPAPQLFDNRIETHYHDIDWGGLAKGLSSLATRLKGGTPVPSGRYRVLVTNTVMAELLRAFSPAFVGRSGRGADLGGTRFGPNFLHIIDDPHLPKRVGTRPWDDEGTPTERLSLVREGFFLNEIQSLETAALAGVASSGHGVMEPKTGRMEPGFHNLFIEPSVKDYVDLLREIGNGLLVTRIRLSPGIDRGGSGFAEIGGLRIENGQEKAPFSRVYLEWDARTFFQKLISLGRDLAWRGAYGSPSALFDDVRILDLV